MIRRAGLVAALLVLVSGTNVSAASKTIGAFLYGYTPARAKITMGTTVTWASSDVTHTATSNNGLFDTGAINGGAVSAGIVFNQAGGFAYHCAIHGAALMHATVKVKMRVSPTTGGVRRLFTLTLGSAAVPSGWQHDVQVSRNGGAFVSLPSTTSTSATYRPGKRGTYRVRTRLHQTTGATTGWSPVAAFSVS